MVSLRATICWRIAVSSALVGLVACHSAPPVGLAPTTPDPCLIGGAAPVDSLNLALFEDVVLGRLSAPVTGAERIVARQLYRTVVRLDCRDELEPDLARRWTSDRDGASWTVELDPEARFEDGTPIDAPAVVASWLRRFRAWPAGSVVSATATGPATIEIRFVDADPSRPRALAELDWAVVGPADRRGRPLASGPFRADSTGVPNELLLIPIEPAGRSRTIRVTSWPGRDPRDLLDPGPGATRPADLLVTADPVALGYARGQPDTRIESLGWDRAYLLVASGDSAPPRPEPFELTSLVRDVVRGDARPVTGPGWWSGPDRCQPSGSSGSPTSGDVGFDALDATARELAERVVALASSPKPPAWLGRGLAARHSARLRPLSVEDLESAERARSLGALIVAVPRAATAGCGGGRRPIGGAAVPLVETRASVVIRRGLSLSLDADGTFRLPRPGRAR